MQGQRLNDRFDFRNNKHRFSRNQRSHLYSYAKDFNQISKF